MRQPATSTASTSTRSRSHRALTRARPPVNTDISVVGDVTDDRRSGDARRRRSGRRLQIAWSGVFPPHPVVFPTLQQARFMAYDAIVAGARGLFFFGGQFKQVMNAADRAARLELDLLAECPAAAARGADGRGAHSGVHRSARSIGDHSGRGDIAFSARRERRVPLPDRGQEEPDRDRHGALLGASGRAHAAGSCWHTPAATPNAVSR